MRIAIAVAACRNHYILTAIERVGQPFLRLKDKLAPKTS